MQALDDPERIARARRGDAAAFDALVKERIGPMLRTAMAIFGREDEAQDARANRRPAASAARWP